MVEREPVAAGSVNGGRQVAKPGAASEFAEGRGHSVGVYSIWEVREMPMLAGYRTGDLLLAKAGFLRRCCCAS